MRKKKDLSKQNEIIEKAKKTIPEEKVSFWIQDSTIDTSRKAKI